MNLPAWATPISNPRDELCEYCKLLPYLAVAPTPSWGKIGGSARERKICRVCVMFGQAQRGDGCFKVVEACYDALTPPTRPRGTLYCKLDIERLIPGATWSYIHRWEVLGWLTGWRRQGQFVVVPFAAVLGFLANPATWMAWEAEKLTESDLRAWAIARRAGWPWHWVEGHEAAHSLGYTFSGLHRLCTTGVLRCAVQYQRRWYVRSDELERFRREVLPTRGTGPAPLYGERMVQENSYMPADYQTGIREYGGGNLSAGIRRLWEEHLARQSRGAAD